MSNGIKRLCRSQMEQPHALGKQPDRYRDSEGRRLVVNASAGLEMRAGCRNGPPLNASANSLKRPWPAWLLPFGAEPAVSALHHGAVAHALVRKSYARAL